MKTNLLLLSVLFLILGCSQKKATVENEPEMPFTWKAANIYFLLTDRFNNGDTSNDTNFNRTKETATLRGFKGGDIKGITQKINDGYFTDLGVNAIWMTPIVEQIHDGTDEGTGVTYGFHGYWTSDWTTLDPNFGTKEDLKNLVETAHKKGIRILLDAVINHTGPVTDIDKVWPNEWVRTAPQCTYDNYANTTACTLVKNLPDIKTESNEAVELPPQLVEKWKSEGRYDEEVAELDAFFNRTGYPRAPRFYIMKWLTDYITEFGIDGYRVDTVKHTEESVWQEFRKECDYAFAEWKKNNPAEVLDDTHFYLVGEVYNYHVQTGRNYDFGDKVVDYFEDSFDALINFNLKYENGRTLEETYAEYDSILNNGLKGFSTLNYLTSHDDGQPFDKAREKPYETATRLLLAPGASQIYYGDELARTLIVEGTEGDATLRSFMDWEAARTNEETKNILAHWQRLGKFRSNHPAVGAGRHQKIASDVGYVFSRDFSKDDYNDTVVVGLNLTKGEKVINVSSKFEEGTELYYAYSGVSAKVTDGNIRIDSAADIVLLERK